MSAEIVRLPTAPTTYVAVRRSGRRWRIDLVTPGPNGRDVATTVTRSSSYDAIRAEAERVGAAMQRPVRLPRGRP